MNDVMTETKQEDIVTDHTRIDPQADEFTAPDWLQDALETSRTPPDFLARCREAGRTAHDMHLLRQQREETEFVCTSFQQYVDDLAQRLGLSLDRVLQWFELTDLETLDREAVRRLARFARELGLSLSEATALLRASFAVATGHATVPLPAPRDPHRRAETPVAACGRRLEQIESGYPEALQEQLLMIRREVEAQYDAGDDRS